MARYRDDNGDYLDDQLPRAADPAPAAPAAPQQSLDDLNKIYGPGGIVYNPPAGNTGWNPSSENWNVPPPSSGTPDPSGATNQGGGGGGGGWSGGSGRGNSGTYGNDAYNLLNNLALRRVGQLNQPASFPMFDNYMNMLQQQQAQARQRAQVFADQMGGRIGELQKPLMGDKEHALVQTQALDNLYRQRDAALNNMRAQTATRGFEPTTGLIAGNERSINEQFGNEQSNIQAKLAAGEIGQNEARRNQAAQLQGLVQQALSGGDLASIQAAAQGADAENQRYNLEQQRAREQLTTANIPVDLSNMGLMNAMGAYGTGGSPSNTLGSLAPFLQMANANSQSQQQGFGSMLDMLLNMFK